MRAANSIYTCYLLGRGAPTLRSGQRLLPTRRSWLERAFTVALVADNKVPQFIEKLRRSYVLSTKLNDEAAAEAIFATKPSSDACSERWIFDYIFFLVCSRMGFPLLYAINE
jgi:hypothetical protein